MGSLVMAAEKSRWNKENGDDGEWDYSYGIGVYFVWSVFHKVPYGEIYPVTNAGKCLSSLICILGILYQPYIIPLVSIRRPSQKEHQELVGKLK